MTAVAAGPTKRLRHSVRAHGRVRRAGLSLRNSSAVARPFPRNPATRRVDRAHREAQAGAQDGVDESKCGISATEEAKLARLYEKYGIATADEGAVNLVNSVNSAGDAEQPANAQNPFII